MSIPQEHKNTIAMHLREKYPNLSFSLVSTRLLRTNASTHKRVPALKMKVVCKKRGKQMTLSLPVEGVTPLELQHKFMKTVDFILAN
jgi:hypothetical protein